MAVDEKDRVGSVMAKLKDNLIKIRKGSTFALPVMWSSTQVTRKPITAISLASGAPRLEASGHGAPNGWACWVTRAKGMTQINAADAKIDERDMHYATKISADIVEFNDISPVDDNGKEWPAYTGGGFLEYNTPVDITGYTADLTIKDKIGGTVLASTKVEHAPLNIITATVDAANHVINLEISATATAALAWKKGVADLEMTSPTGKVTKLKVCTGPDEEPDQVAVYGEVTT